MWTVEFWRAAAERAVKTMAQALLSLLGVMSMDLLTVDWKQALMVVLGAGLASVLTSLVGANFIGPEGSPSWVVDRNAQG